MSSSSYKEYDPEPGLEGRKGDEASERVGLLSQHVLPVTDANHIDDGRHLMAGSNAPTPRYALKHLLASFAGGITACLAVQLSLFGVRCFSFRERTGNGGAGDEVGIYAPPWVGSTTVHNYPPPSPTNNFPDIFPTEYAFRRSRILFL